MAETYASRTLREIVRIIAGRFGGIVLILAIVVVAAWIATYFSPRQYRSEVTMNARPAGVANPLEARPTSMRDEISLFMGSQRQIIESDYVLASALMRLDGREILPPAAEDAKLVVRWYDDQAVSEYAGQNTRRLRDLRKRVQVVTPGGPDATFTQTFVIRVDWPEERAIAGDRDVDSRELAAERAYEMAGYIQEAYRFRHMQLEIDRTMQAAAFMQGKSLATAKADLDKAVKEQSDFIAKDLKGNLTVVINLIGGRAVGTETGVALLSRQFQAEIIKTKILLAELNAVKSAIDVELAKSDPAEIAIPDSVAKSNPVLVTLQEKIVTLQLQVNMLELRFTEDYRELRNSRNELAAAQADLRKEMVKQSTRVTQEISVQQARLKEARGQVDKDQKLMDDLAVKAVRYERLCNNVQAVREIYNREQERVMSAVRAQELASTSVLVAVQDGPTRPDSADPRRPIVLLNMLIAIAAGVIIALVYAFLADHFDHTIKSIDDAERYLGMPVLASVPKLGRRIIRTI